MSPGLSDMILYKWPAIAVFTAVWIFPSVLVHGYGQHLERQFSQFGNG